MTEEEKKIITRERHPGRGARIHKLAALMKKRKEEILSSLKNSSMKNKINHQNDVICFRKNI